LRTSRKQGDHVSSCLPVCLLGEIWIHEFVFYEIRSTQWKLSTKINASSFHKDPRTINNREKEGVYVVAPGVTLIRAALFTLD
jgi:hypothetical protein